ncbi:MAG TPA: ABC transporter permease subunit [Streptosporangiales bacterium]
MTDTATRRRPVVAAPVVRRSRRPTLAAFAIAAMPVLVVIAFIGFPVVMAILYSFGFVGGTNSVVALIAQDQHTGFPTFGAYAAVIGDGASMRNLAATVIVTVVSVALVLVLSWSIALYLRLSDSAIARVLSALSVVPLFIPVVIASYAILNFYAGDGLPRTIAHLFGWNSFPTLSYTIVAVTIGEIWTQLPFGVLLMTSGMQAVPNALIEAARDAGARMPRVVRSVLLPMTLVQTVIVATFAAIYVLGSFTVPFVIGPNAPNLLGVAMTAQFQSYGRPQQAAVLAVIVFVIAAGIGVAYVWANVRANKRSGATR